MPDNKIIKNKQKQTKNIQEKNTMSNKGKREKKIKNKNECIYIFFIGLYLHIH